MKDDGNSPAGLKRVVVGGEQGTCMSQVFFNERIKIWSRNYSLSVAFAALILQLTV